MKKILLLFILAGLTIVVSAQSTVSSLTTTTSINDADWLMLIQNGNSRKIAVSNLLQNMAPLASPTFITPNLGTPSAGTLTNCSFPTLNQNTTGSAATLTTARAIYGNNFDGSAALTQVIASTYGGTGNGFTKFTGPTTAEKTFTLPDASATLLYSGGALGTPSSGTLTNCTFPTLNQNTTGSAATLTTARTIGGVSFDGSANITVESATGDFAVTGRTTTATLTLGGTAITSSGAEINVLDGIPGTLTATELGYVDGVTSSIQDQLDDTLLLNTVVKILTDTSLYFAPVIGVGNANDTTLFSTGDIIWGAKWGGSHNFVITKITAVNGAGSKDIDIAFLHDANFKDATPTEVLSADLTVTSSTTGDEATSFNSATIAPDQWIWARIDQCTAQPTQCIINIYGYLTE